MKPYRLLACLLTLGLTSSAWAATPGTVAIDPFDPGISASVGGLGGSSATMGGLWSLTYNPAGLSDVKDRTEADFYQFQVGASFLRWFDEQSVGYGSVALPPGFALGVANFDQGTITTSTGFFGGGTEKISDFGVVGGYGTALPGDLSNISLGISAQYWQRNLAEYKSSTFAVNLGGRVTLLDQKLALGAYVQNLGPSLKFETAETDDQPLGYTVGASWTSPPGTSPVGYRIAADAIKMKDQDVAVAGGGELVLQRFLALRVGANTSGDKTHPTYGAGLIYKGFTFDYSFSNLSLSDEDIATHLVSMGFSLGGNK